MSDTFTGNTYVTLCDDAEGYLANESPEQARELLQKAISLIGTRPRARSLLADTCMIMELWSEARSQLEILITLDEGNSNNNFRLAQVLEELGEYQLALDNYSVVLEIEPDHHGAGVALKRIEAKNKDSGVNLTDIFNSPQESEDGTAQIVDEGKDDFKDGLQVFPDVPSDELFADSEDSEDDSVEQLLKNIGISDSSTEEEENDVSELLENIGVSTTDALQAAFEGSDDAGEEAFSDGQNLSEGTGVAEDDSARKPVRSLDEIFGTSSVLEEEEEEPEAEETPEEEPEPEAEISEEVSLSPFAPDEEKADITAKHVFGSSETLEAIFNAPKPEEEEVEEEAAVEEEAEAEEAEEEVEEEAAVEEEAEAEEAEEEVEEEAVVEEEPEAEEAEEEVEEEAVVEEEPEAEEAEEEVEEEAAVEEEPEAEEKVKEAAETFAEDRTAVPTILMKQEADFRIDPWSSESGLITVHMTSGTVSVKDKMLSIYEKSLETVSQEEGIIELSGNGTFLLNCGEQNPLIVELKENMVIRKDAVILNTGIIPAELLDIPDNDSLYVIKEQIREKVIFCAEHPVRVILLGGNNRVFYVRTSSIMVTGPEIMLSNTGTPDSFTEVTGLGKVYLIE